MSTLDEMEMPTLTFDPAPEEKAPVVPVQEEKAKLDDSMLNDKERQMVESFAKQIDLHNTNGILQYGAGTQKKMADFSEKALENVKTKDLGSVGDMLTNVVTELKSFDAQEEEKGFFSFLKKPVDKITSMKTKYDKVETNVEKICTALEDHQTQLMKDVAMLDRMYEQNLLYFKELSMYILAGKKKLEEVQEGQLKELLTKAQASGLAEDAQAARDLEAMCGRFEKKVHDLELTRTIAEHVSIPVIASGGCGSLEHFSEVFEKTGCDAALAASLFHYRELTVGEVKKHLKEKGIPVRK